MANPVGKREAVDDEESPAAGDDGQGLLSQAATIQRDQKEMFASSFQSAKTYNDRSMQPTQQQLLYKESDFWEPQLRKLRGYGMVHSEKFSWPSQSLLKQFDADRIIKLCGIELGMTSNLFEVRLCFTGGLRSPLMRAEGAGLTQQQDEAQQTFEIDPSRCISQVSIN